MPEIIVTPAYGRDYSNKDDAIHDWVTGLDFVLRNDHGRPCRTYCSMRDFETGTAVKIRYDKDHKFCYLVNP